MKSVGSNLEPGNVGIVACQNAWDLRYFKCLFIAINLDREQW